MKVGDLVRYNHTDWIGWYGLIIREIPGTDERKIVKWARPPYEITSNPKRDLELVSESR